MTEQRLLPREFTEYYIKKTTIWANAVLLVAHLLFAVFFWCHTIDVLFIYNSFSIVIYILSFFLLKKWNYKNSKSYIFTIFLEMYVFMFFSTICLGWQAGFQNYCIAFTSSFLFTDFYKNSKKQASLKKIVFGVFNALLYVLLYFGAQDEFALYVMPDSNIIRMLFSLNSLASYAFFIMFLMIYYNAVQKMKFLLQEAAEHDSLTGLYNRRTMLQVLNQKLDFNKKNNYAIAMLDVDFFKKINDTYGHNAGDEALRYISKKLCELGDSTDDNFWISRWGGEEFLFLYRYNTNETDIEITEKFEQLRKNIESGSVFYEDVVIRLTVTIGLVFVNENKEIKDWIKTADNLLYLGKKKGRNRLIT